MLSLREFDGIEDPQTQILYNWHTKTITGKREGEILSFYLSPGGNVDDRNRTVIDRLCRDDFRS